MIRPGDTVRWRGDLWRVAHPVPHLGLTWVRLIRRVHRMGKDGFTGAVTQLGGLELVEALSLSPGQQVRVGPHRRAGIVISFVPGEPVEVEHPAEIRETPGGTRWTRDAHRSLPSPHMINI